MYCVVGRCDPREDHAEAAVSTDDYLWIKLTQAVVDEDDSRKPDRLTLTQLQTLLLDDFGLNLPLIQLFDNTNKCNNNVILR